MVRERNIDWLPLARVPTRDPARNPGMCSDWELNLQQFGLQDHAQPSAPCWSGTFTVFTEKNPRVSGPALFGSVWFKGQLYSQPHTAPWVPFQAPRPAPHHLPPPERGATPPTDNSRG